MPLPRRRCAHESAALRHPLRRIRGARRVPRGGPHARSARDSFAVHRQARAGLQAHAARRREARLRARGHERQGVAAERMGLVVRLLPRRTPAAGRDVEEEPGAHRGTQLQGRARRRDAMAETVRQSLFAFRFRRGWQGRHRLRRVWRAGDVRDRQEGRHSLQADRADHARSARENPDAAHPRAERVKRLLAVGLLALASTWAFGQADEVARPDPVVERRLTDLAEELRCLVCQNQTIADSNAPLALDLRNQIRQQVAAGRSDDQIRAYMVERYGDFVLYRPPFKATTAVLWLGPLLLIVVGAGAFFTIVRQRRCPAGEPPTETRRAEIQALLEDAMLPPPGDGGRDTVSTPKRGKR